MARQLGTPGQPGDRGQPRRRRRRIGAALVAKAAPDGYTAHGHHRRTRSTSSCTRSWPMTRRATSCPGSGGQGAQCAGGAPSQPYKTVKELIAYAKTHPGKVTYASAGNGTSIHLAGALFEQMAQVDMVHGTLQGQRAGDCRSAGRPDLVQLRQPALGHAAHQVGALRAIAVTGSARFGPAAVAHDRRKRPAGLRRHLVVRSVAPAALPAELAASTARSTRSWPSPRCASRCWNGGAEAAPGTRSSSPASSRPRRPSERWCRPPTCSWTEPPALPPPGAGPGGRLNRRCAL
jgi:hypothetical protein